MVARKGKSIFAGFFSAIGKFFATPESAEAKTKAANRSSAQPAPRNVKQHRDNNAQDRRPSNRNQGNRDNGALNETNNKTRPVAVAKSNNRIQTVRPAQANHENKPVDEQQAMQQPRQPRQPRNNNATNPRNNNQAPRAAEPTTVRETVPASAPQQQRQAVNKPVAPKADSVAAEHNKVAVAEKAVVKPNVAPFVNKPVVVQQVKPILVQPVEEAPKPVVVAKPAEAVVKAEPVVAVAQRPKVVKPIEPVDLGSLQLVNTNQELLKKPQPEVIEVVGKRFSDLVIKEKVIDSNINYELVETKR
jgi:hypothetical protein